MAWFGVVAVVFVVIQDFFLTDNNPKYVNRNLPNTPTTATTHTTLTTAPTRTKPATVTTPTTLTKPTTPTTVTASTTLNYTIILQ